MNASPPIHPEVGVLALVGHEWTPYWQVPHQVLTGLSRYYRVVWMNPAHEWRRRWSLGIAPRRVQACDHDLPPGLEVYVPGPLLPRMHRPAWLGAALAKQRIRRARRMLLRKGCRKLVLYLWRPHYAYALSVTRHDVSCYHIDDEFSFSPVELPLDESEARLIRSVDCVFISSPKMLEKKGSLNPCTLLCRNGVNFSAFSQEAPEPPDLTPIPHPRIGYIGFIKKQLDWPLLEELAARHPEWSFVFVGKRSPHPVIDEPVGRLKGLPNVTFLGERSVSCLSAYPQHFDVCLMPYRLDDYTKYIDPLKLREYLACGRPVVGSPIPAVEEVSHLIEVASTPDEWSAAVSKLLGPAGRDPEARRARQEDARRHDWQVTVRSIAETIAARLDIGLGESPAALGGAAVGRGSAHALGRSEPAGRRG